MRVKYRVAETLHYSREWVLCRSATAFAKAPDACASLWRGEVAEVVGSAVGVGDSRLISTNFTRYSMRGAGQYRNTRSTVSVRKLGGRANEAIASQRGIRTGRCLAKCAGCHGALWAVLTGFSVSYGGAGGSGLCSNTGALCAGPHGDRTEGL